MFFVFAISGEGKCEINYLKKKFFFPFRELFHFFFVENLPEEMIRKCFGGKEKE